MMSGSKDRLAGNGRHRTIEAGANPRGTEPDVPRTNRLDRWRNRRDAVGESRSDHRAAGNGEIDAGRRTVPANRRGELFSVAADEVQHAGGNFRRGELEGTRGRRLPA